MGSFPRIMKKKINLQVWLYLYFDQVTWSITKLRLAGHLHPFSPATLLGPSRGEGGAGRGWDGRGGDGAEQGFHHLLCLRASSHQEARASLAAPAFPDGGGVEQPVGRETGRQGGEGVGGGKGVEASQLRPDFALAAGEYEGRGEGVGEAEEQEDGR